MVKNVVRVRIFNKTVLERTSGNDQDQRFTRKDFVWNESVCLTLNYDAG